MSSKRSFDTLGRAPEAISFVKRLVEGVRRLCTWLFLDVLTGEFRSLGPDPRFLSPFDVRLDGVACMAFVPKY